ncbi:LysR family transcriptional regulator [Roseinatronobacter alkalisoli]|uniref:LysR family transcriptional regulator n=1 Tax=Roseinatronobacter alkalisoli TaxID=3028235 RepID=A0ABT5TCV6_9RHOB|nr:LysR family transcriptional regulator [Roseinatronobacter sp. HJB301]MDD7972958.1 LysR family transcriptional regulator [Roseinatronobacter sp. HJB301]
MKSIRLESFDLNLMKLFVALAETGSVTRAAAQIGLTQPSASNALQRMRLTLGDPLFVRSKREMVPTRYAALILPTVRATLSALSEALNHAADFEPQESRRRFRVSLSGLGEAVFLPVLATMVGNAAPFVVLENDPVPLSKLGESLLSGRIDLALGLVAVTAPGIRNLPLYQESYVAISAPDREQVPQTISDLRNERLVLVAPAATFGREIQTILTRLGLQGNVALIVQEFAALPELLQGGRYLAIVPGIYGEKLARSGRAKVLPVAFGHPETPVNMVWANHAESDAGFRWFRDLVERSLVGQTP